MLRTSNFNIQNRFFNNRTLTAAILLFGNLCISQSDTIVKQQPKIQFSGFIDVFYVYDVNQPANLRRQPFLYNHNRHNEFNLNLGFIKTSVTHSKYRANLALHAGTYVNDNYASEPGLIRNIFEANVGFSLNKKNNLWIDAGIFPSLIGFESAISIDNWTLTRSLLAENSPYYLSGAKLSYLPRKNLEITAMICNGWQRIQKVARNSIPALCTQIKFTPNDKTTINWSSFIGTDDPDSFRRMRYYNNFFGQFQFTEKLGLIAGFDIGTQQITKNSTQYNVWFSPVIIVRYVLADHWSTAFRAEYYQDENGVIIPTINSNGFNTSGLSLNIDYSPIEKLSWRIEGRWLNSQDNIFRYGSGFSAKNFFIATSIAILFEK